MLRKFSGGSRNSRTSQRPKLLVHNEHSHEKDEHAGQRMPGEELSWTSPDVPTETNFGRGGEGKLKLEVVSSKAVAESH
jgi:hypothetical protein